MFNQAHLAGRIEQSTQSYRAIDQQASEVLYRSTQFQLQGIVDKNMDVIDVPEEITNSLANEYGAGFVVDFRYRLQQDSICQFIETMRFSIGAFQGIDRLCVY
jgi:hypothetical protein